MWTKFGKPQGNAVDAETVNVMDILKGAALKCGKMNMYRPVGLKVTNYRGRQGFL